MAALRTWLFISCSFALAGCDAIFGLNADYVATSDAGGDDATVSNDGGDDASPNPSQDAQSDGTALADGSTAMDAPISTDAPVVKDASPEGESMEASTCDPACAMGVACSNGTCGCGEGQSQCETDDTCFDIQTDATHCGAECMTCGDTQSCVDGECACPSSTPTYCASNATCVDTTNDANNCGSCGHSCGSNANAACVNSACVPYSLGVIAANGIAVDGTYIYVAVSDGTANATGTILQCPKSTGCPFTNPVTLDSGLTRPSGVALSGGVLYWATEGQNNMAPGVGATLKSCTLKTNGTGCASSPSTLYTGNAGTNQFGAIAVANGAVYAVDRRTVFSPTTTTTGNAWSQPTYVNGLAVAGPKVYMTTSAGVYDANVPFTTSGAGLGLYAADYGGNIGGASYDSSSGSAAFFWLDLFSPTMTGHAELTKIVTGASGGVTTIATGLNAPQDIASDGTNVYWGDANGNVYYCPVAGCSPTTSPKLLGTGPGMASLNGSFNSIVADGSFVTWTTFSKIMTVAVP